LFFLFFSRIKAIKRKRSESEHSDSVASSPEKKHQKGNKEVGRQSLFSMPRNSIFDVDPKMNQFFTVF